jgi:perosamine synthetase
MTIQRFGSEEINAVKNVIKNASYLSGFSNKYLGGEEIQKFENEFAKFHGCKYGISVNSGTSALFVSLKASKINKKSNVSVPCLSFTATTSQVLATGGRPNFMDIDKNSYCMNHDFSNKSITHAIPVHLLGHPCKLNMIKQMKENKIFVIEDCAQSAGAKTQGKSVGSLGDCGIFSFQETKHITTMGEGGMIITNNEEFAKKCQMIRNHGEYYKDDSSVGYNFRLTEMQAAFGRVQLKKLPKLLKTFKKNAKLIIKNLPPQIIPPEIPKNIEHSFFILGCKFDNDLSLISRDEFLKKLTNNRKKFLKGESKSDIKGINFRPGKIIGPGYSSVQYGIPLYTKFKPKKKCHVGENFVKESIFLDIHRWRSTSEIKEELNFLQNTI